MKGVRIKSEADDFITKLPQGYDTMDGECIGRAEMAHGHRACSRILSSDLAPGRGNQCPRESTHSPRA